ncbi:GerAB/ArcD/ProY family transporter [Paenibacillus agri]|uniref:Endospore germination permease n=1 Tax=Paenibacillus agri TaxID=2744309 RepID=A0A850EIR3_9BACL|nr:endospore germination permease [Paenibacillus agri]NUU59294.1 endospore germination permease [Paenibacillus agri]
MNNRPITTMQAVAVIVSTIIGIGILTFPRFMAEAGDSGAPMVTASGIFIAFIGFWFTASVCRKFPNETLFIFSRRLVGAGLADFLTGLIVVFFAFSSGITMRQFGEVCVSVIFKKTPIEAVILLMLLLGCLSIRRNIVKFTYIHAFYLPLILLPVLIIILVSLKEIDVLNLLPVTGNQLTPRKFTTGMLTSASLYQGTFILTLLVPFMKKPQKVMKAGASALLLIVSIYVLIVIVSVGMFGAQETLLLFYPTLETARSISLGAGLLERFDAIFIIVWVISIFTTIFSNFYMAAYAFKELARFQDHRLVASFLLPFIFGSSLLPDNVFQTYDIASATAMFGLILLTFYPFLLWLTATIREKRGRSA